MTTVIEVSHLPTFHLALPLFTFLLLLFRKSMHVVNAEHP